jgi:nucleoside 2-deoxyribosyltransferase
MKKAFVICTVRGASEEYKNKLEAFVQELESNGYNVHLPHRDTNQDVSGLDICTENCNAIREADVVFIFYSKTSQGTHFDMGCAFALKKKLFVVENEEYGEGKSFPRMLDEWSLLY